MDSKRLGHSAVEVTELGFGGGPLGGLFAPLTDDAAAEALAAAWEGGIRYFDTSPHYGIGHSERRIGEFLRQVPREQYVLSTEGGRLLLPQDPAGRMDEFFQAPATHRRVGTSPATASGAASRTPSPAWASTASTCCFCTTPKNTSRPHSVTVTPHWPAASIFDSGVLVTPRPGPDARFEYRPASEEVLRRAHRIADVCEAHGVTLPEAATAFPCGTRRSPASWSACARPRRHDATWPRSPGRCRNGCGPTWWRAGLIDERASQPAS